MNMSYTAISFHTYCNFGMQFIINVNKTYNKNTENITVNSKVHFWLKGRSLKGEGR